MNEHSTKCARHKDREKSVEDCHICHRLRIEEDIVKRTVGVFILAGYYLATDQSTQGMEWFPPIPTQDAKKILAELFEVDDEYLGVFKPADNRIGWVRFVYGNDGYDVISDYTVNLEEVLKPVNEYARSLS
jgi:hypothetical protein